MSYDLILKRPDIIRKSWARDDVSYKSIMSATAAGPKLVPTAEEKARISKLAALRMKAESGDRTAKKEWQRVSTKVAALRVRARGGDPKAVRACQILEDSGLFGKSRNISVNGWQHKHPHFAAYQAEKHRRALLGKFVGRDDFLGKFVGDEERTLREIGPSERKDCPSGKVPVVRMFADETKKKNPLYVRRTVCEEPGKVDLLKGSLSEFVGDEERTLREAGLSERSASNRVHGDLPSEIVGRWSRRSSKRKRHLRRLVWQSARGDANASAKLQQITMRLQQRSNAGDARAAALLQQIQSMQSSAQAKFAAQPATTAVITPPPGAPPAAPPPAPINVTYPAPGYPTPDTDYSEDSEYSNY